jgi:hypothetical protein
MKRGPRGFHKLYANLMGYFWLPCPVCGEMFGGHEAESWSIPTDRAGISECVCSEECEDLFFGRGEQHE